MRVGILICTAGRPQMLRDCLNSIIVQTVDARYDVEIIVVENDDKPASRESVLGLSDASPFKLFHVLEPVRGIPFARNRTLREARERGYEWLVLIDDDEVAAEGWLASHLDVAERYGADVTYGRILQDYEQEPPAWWPHGVNNPPAEGTSLTRASTGNVSFSAALIDPDRGNLTFNQIFCYGYEDLDLFERAVAIGFKIVSAPNAIITECVPANRVTPQRLAAFARSSAAAHVQAGILRKGYWPSVFKFSLKGVRRVVSAGILIALLYPLYKGGIRGLEKRYYKAIMRLSRGIGNLLGVFGKPSKYYDTIDGQ